MRNEQDNELGIDIKKLVIMISEEYACPRSLLFLRNSVRPRKEFLISAVKLQLSIASQMCPLDSLLLRQNAEDGKLIKTSYCLLEFDVSHALKLEQKEAISIPVSGKDLLAVFPTGFGKSPIVQVLIRMKEIMAGKPSNVVVGRNKHLRSD